MKLELDAMDAKILDILQADARTTLAEIGRGVSADTSDEMSRDEGNRRGSFSSIH